MQPGATLTTRHSTSITEMKGPFERLKYDLRRVWKCPACGHLERTTGGVTTQLCNCQSQIAPSARRFMQLVEDGVRRNQHAVVPENGSTSVAPSTVAEPTPPEGTDGSLTSPT